MSQDAKLGHFVQVLGRGGISCGIDQLGSSAPTPTLPPFLTSSVRSFCEVRMPREPSHGSQNQSLPQERGSLGRVSSTARGDSRGYGPANRSPVPKVQVRTLVGFARCADDGGRQPPHPCLQSLLRKRSCGSRLRRIPALEVQLTVRDRPHERYGNPREGELTTLSANSLAGDDDRQEGGTAEADQSVRCQTCPVITPVDPG